MAQNRSSGRRTAEALLARLRAAPVGLAGKTEADARSERAGALTRSLHGIVRAIAALSGRVEHAVTGLPDGQIIMSFPRPGRICAARIPAEIGDVRDRFRTDDQPAAGTGVCPVTHASGESRAVVSRRACTHRLRKALTGSADDARHRSPWAADTCGPAPKRGCDHLHAIRLLARAWLRILWKARTERTLRDPANHQAPLSLAART